MSTKTYTAEWNGHTLTFNSRAKATYTHAVVQFGYKGWSDAEKYPERHDPIIFSKHTSRERAEKHITKRNSPVLPPARESMHLEIVELSMS